MSVDFFIDSNIAVYALSTPSAKRDIARTLISKQPAISTQVIMETANVLIKKFKFEKAMAFRSCLEIIDATELTTITQITLIKAFDISLKYQLSHWDSLIIASALEAGCSTLYTEDLRHGQVIGEKLTLVNPFL